MKLDERNVSPPVTDDLLREIVRRIRAAGDPLKIILFGSHARGDAGPGSDLDILVIEESGLPRWKRSPKYYRATHGTFPGRDRDIVVWTPEEVEVWKAVSNHFITTAVREGRVLYERSG
jgi:predicted nucleotidyltransferase